MASPFDDIFGGTMLPGMNSANLVPSPFGVGREQSPAQLGVSQGMLTLANMPDTGFRPQGVGEGIQQVAQGIAGAQMQRMQLNMMRYMLPMQMMQARVNMAKAMAPQAIPTKYGIGLYQPLTGDFKPGLGISQLETGQTGIGAPLGNDASEGFFRQAQDEPDPLVKQLLMDTGNNIKSIPDPIEQHKMAITGNEAVARLRASRQQQEWMHNFQNQFQAPLDMARTHFYGSLAGKNAAQIATMRQGFINEWGQDPLANMGFGAPNAQTAQPSQMAAGSVQQNGQGVGTRVAKNVTPTSPMRGMGEYAQTINQHIPALVQDVQMLAAKGKLGPIRGRFNDFLVGTVGKGDADFAKLRADLGFLDTGTLKAHMGAGGAVEVMKHFESLFNDSMDAPTLIAGLRSTQDWMQHYMNQGSIPTNVGTFVGGQPMSGGPGFPGIPPAGNNPQDQLLQQLLSDQAARSRQ